MEDTGVVAVDTSEIAADPDALMAEDALVNGRVVS